MLRGEGVFRGEGMFRGEGIRVQRGGHSCSEVGAVFRGEGISSWVCGGGFARSKG